MNNFQKKEAQGRKLFKDYADKFLPEVCHITFNKDEFDSTDCFYMSGYSSTQAELKTRDYNHTQTWNGYPEGWIFEKIKWDELKAMQRTGYTDSVYICIFRDALVVWNLTTTPEPNWIEKPCQSTHECKKKVMKKVTYLKLSEASHIYKHSFEFSNKPQI